MKFYVNTAYLPLAEILALARAADTLGYDGLGIPEHVVHLAEPSTSYPYSSDGQRRWPPFTDWPDPWVLVGGLAMCTTHLHFVTTVSVPALRDPFTAAKSIATAAVLSDGRVELGIGIGWSRDEFDILGADFAHRGARTDEMIALMRALWEPGWTEFDGTYYQAPRLEMSPTPPPIPTLIGGLTDIALRRAARHDGWIGDSMTTGQAIDTATRLHRLRHELSHDDEFSIVAPLTDATDPGDYQRAAAAGITHILTMPWMYYSGPDASTAQKIADMERFRDTYMHTSTPE